MPSAIRADSSSAWALAEAKPKRFSISMARISGLMKHVPAVLSESVLKNGCPVIGATVGFGSEITTTEICWGLRLHMGNIKQTRNSANKKPASWTFIIFSVSVVAAISASFVTNSNQLTGIIFLAIPFVIEYARKKDPITYYRLDFETFKTLNFKFILAISVITFVLFAVVDTFFGLWEYLIDPDSNVTSGGTSVALAKSNFFFLAVFTVFTATLIEELWFRGIIQQKICNIDFLSRFNPHFAVLIQSTLFGLAHFLPAYFGTDLPLFTKIYFFVFPFVIGLVIGYLNAYYRSLWPGWILHFVINLSMTFALVVYFRFY